MWDCATPATQNEGGCEIVPHLPCKSAAASLATKTSPSAPPSAISATPATQNEGGCEIAPRLPRKTKVDVRLCHTCHAKVPRRPSRLKPAQARHPVPWVPRLPRKTKVDGRLCHACHVKRTSMSPSATPATQSAAVSRRLKPAQARHPVPQVPRLPRKTRLCHACHAKRRWMGYAMPAMQNEGGGGGGGGGGSGYRIKNKNPTQSCGEKNEKDYFCHVSQTLSVHTRGGHGGYVNQVVYPFCSAFGFTNLAPNLYIGGVPVKGPC